MESNGIYAVVDGKGNRIGIVVKEFLGFASFKLQHRENSRGKMIVTRIVD